MTTRLRTGSEREQLYEVALRLIEHISRTALALGRLQGRLEYDRSEVLAKRLGRLQAWQGIALAHLKSPMTGTGNLPYWMTVGRKRQAA